MTISDAPNSSDDSVRPEDVASQTVERLEPYVLPEHRPKVEMIVEEGVEAVVHHHSGPLPRAADLADYNQIDPSFAERIVRMAEREQQHRHAFPAEVLSKDYAIKSRGQNYALILAFGIILFAAYLAWLGDTAMAGKVAIGTLVGIVAIFVSGRLIDRAAREDRNDAGE